MVHVKAPRLLLAALLTAGLLAPAGAAAAPNHAKRKAQGVCTNTDLMPAAGNLPVIRAAVLCLHNQERSARGLAPLKENAKLRKAAKGHSDNMVAKGFFDHTAPDGTDMVDRILGTGYGAGQGWSPRGRSTPRGWLRRATRPTSSGASSATSGSASRSARPLTRAGWTAPPTRRTSGSAAKEQAPSDGLGGTSDRGGGGSF
jgi:hypothetical protein